MSASGTHSFRPALKQPASPAKHGVNLHRKLFIRQLIPQIGGYKYAWLAFGSHTVESLAESPYLDLAIDERDLDEWIHICLHAPHVMAHQVERQKDMAIIFLELKEESFMEITLIHCGKRKHSLFSEPRLILEQARMNEEGMKLAPLVYVVEYLFSDRFENSDSQKALKAYYQFLPMEQKRKILQQLSAKYKTANANGWGNTGSHATAWQWIKQTGHHMWSSLRL